MIPPKKEQGRLEIVNILVERNSDPNQKNEFGKINKEGLILMETIKIKKVTKKKQIKIK